MDVTRHAMSRRVPRATRATTRAALAAATLDQQPADTVRAIATALHDVLVPGRLVALSAAGRALHERIVAEKEAKRKIQKRSPRQPAPPVEDPLANGMPGSQD